MAAKSPERTSETTSFAGGGFESVFAELGGDGRSACNGLQAGSLATAALNSCRPGNSNMADVSSDSCRAALQYASANNPGADAGGDFKEDHVVLVGPAGRPLAEGHDIDIVIDEYGNVKGLLNISGDIESVPSRHDRRAGRLSRWSVLPDRAARSRQR